jgi:SOS-response transcriptional repressor LexA
MMVDKDKADRLKFAWRRLFGTIAEAATFLGVNSSTFGSHQNGTRGFDDVVAAHYADRLGVDRLWLLYGKGHAPAAGPVAAAPGGSGRSPDFMPAIVPFPARRQALPVDLPVHGLAAASPEGSFSFMGGVVDYVRRPPALEHARDAYAIFVTGTSMEPAHQEGDLLFVHPHRPPAIGDTVIVERRARPDADLEAFLAILLRRTEKKIIVRKLNPERTIEFDVQQVTRLHKVLRTRELFGI